MARLAILGPTRPGRYPRWGYLDRFETNAVLPRACAATLACLSLLAVSLSISLHFWPAKEQPPSSSRHKGIEVAPITPVPWPQPPRVREQPPTPVPVSQPRWGTVRFVDDSVAETDSIGPGGEEASRTGVGTSDVGQEGDGLEPGTEPAPLPARDETFVAVEHEPELKWMRQPAYPEIARDAGIEGLVLLRVLVAADGTVLQVALLRGVVGLDEAALEAAKTAIFRPALQQGLPVQAWVVIPIEFSLR